MVDLKQQSDMHNCNNYTCTNSMCDLWNKCDENKQIKLILRTSHQAILKRNKVCFIANITN